MDVRRSEHLDGCQVTWADELVTLSGEIDELNADTIAARLCAGLAGTVVTLDLTSVAFFSAAGIRLLAKVGSGARGADTIVHVNCSPGVWRIVTLCGATGLPGLVLDRDGSSGNGTPP
jgi:anti-anti-sigma factor